MGAGPAWRVGLQSKSNSKKKEVFSFSSSREVEAELVGKAIVSSEFLGSFAPSAEDQPKKAQKEASSPDSKKKKHGTGRGPPSVVFRTSDGSEYRLRVFPGWRSSGKRWRFVETASDSFVGQQPPAHHPSIYQNQPQAQQQQQPQQQQQIPQRRRSSAPPQNTSREPTSPSHSVVVREPGPRDFPLYVTRAYYLPEALCLRAAREHSSRVLLRWAYVSARKQGGCPDPVCFSIITGNTNPTNAPGNRSSISGDMHRTPSSASSAGLTITPSSSAPGTPVRSSGHGPGSGRRSSAAAQTTFSVPAVSSSAQLDDATTDISPRQEQQQPDDKRQDHAGLRAVSGAAAVPLARLPVPLVQAVEAFLPPHGEALQWRWGVRNEHTHTPQLERVVRKTSSPKKNK